MSNPSDFIIENGILTVVLPKMKKEETKVSRMIEIA